MKKLLFTPIIIAGLLVSCNTKSGTSTTSIPTTNKSIPATSENIAQGKTIYDNSCGKCHDLPDPKKFTDEKWVGIMSWMAPKAKLDDRQKALALVYATNSN